jgi:hypothetical protein
VSRRAILFPLALMSACSGGVPGEERTPGRSDPAQLVLPNPGNTPIIDPGNIHFIDLCLGNLRPKPVLDQSRTKPATDPTNCVDLTPKVGFIQVSSLPAQIKNTLIAQNAGGKPLAATDSLLLYVPPASSDGKRRVTLSGSASCNPDPCPGTINCGKPTEEKCPTAQIKPTACAASIPLPGGATISLASTTLSADLVGNGQLVAKAYRGVVIAASEITISGTVRTNGNNLVLVASTLKGQSNPVVDVSALRSVIEQAPSPGGRVLVAADTVNAPGLKLIADGAPGGLPRTRLPNGIHIHPDCEDTSPNVNGSSTCFPCVPAGGCNPTLDTVVWNSDNQCLTHGALSGGSLTYFWDYPFTTVMPPAGGDGGPQGYARLIARTNLSAFELYRGGGPGAHSLEPFGYCSIGYFLYNGSCDGDVEYAYLDFERSGKTPSSFQEEYPAGTVPPSFASEAELAQLLTLVADEFVTGDEARLAGEKAYRAGNLATAKTQYQRVLDVLGAESVAPCSLWHRHRSLVAEATGKLAQLDAGLDFLGHSPAWAPSTPPALLQGQVQSRLQETTALAQDLKLNALLSIVSADHNGKVGLYLNQADGDLAQLASDVDALHLQEKQAQLDEVSVHVQRAQTQFQIIQSKLYGYLDQKKQENAVDVGGTLAAIKTLGVALKGIYDAVKDIFSATTAGSLAGSVGTAVGAVVGVVNAAQDLANKINALNAPGFSCSADPTCVGYVQQVTQATSELQGALFALKAAQLAVQGQQADAKLFEAQRQASLDVVRKLQDNKYVVADFDDLARAGQALCHYGRLEVDRAVGEEQAFKRAAAVWDAPNPSADSALYGGSGTNYAYDFNQLISPGCQSSNCTLWGDFNNFLSARNQYLFPNSTTPYYLGLSSADAHGLAIMLGQTLQVPSAGAPGAANATTTRRAEIRLGLVTTLAGQFFGARPSNEAFESGAPLPSMVLNGVNLSSVGSIQVVGMDAWGDSGGQPLRIDFPWQVSRPSSERYRTRNNPPGELDLDVSIPDGRTVDDGLLLDRLQWDAPSGRFTVANCCDVNANPDARPESLEKGWTLWVPVCPDCAAPSQACATEDELQKLSAVHIAARLRYRAVP